MQDRVDANLQIVCFLKRILDDLLGALGTHRGCFAQQRRTKDQHGAVDDGQRRGFGNHTLYLSPRLRGVRMEQGREQQVDQ